MSNLENLSKSLVSLLDRVHKYCSRHTESDVLFGLCVINPKHALVGFPSEDVRLELERRATEHFRSLEVDAYYLRYWTPPLLRIANSKDVSSSTTANDYQMTFELPTFDDAWQRTAITRSLIYCPLDEEQHGWSEWFELQLEASRLTPLLHQTLRECEILGMIQKQLRGPGLPVFESFIHDYALNDECLPMSVKEKKAWNEKKIDWKVRYHFIKDLFSSSASLQTIYRIGHDKAASSRNPMIKNLLWAFLKSVEDSLIVNTQLPEEEKKRQLAELRSFKGRESKKGKYQAKRPAICISDLECGQILYELMQTFLSAKLKSRVVAEAMLFIWIAQHGAFSGVSLKVEDILSIKIKNIDMQALTILIAPGVEIDITAGLKEVLSAYMEDENQEKKLFTKLSYDNLEELLEKCSEKLYGVGGRLLPRDFLEKVHTVQGARIPLDLRRQITRQEAIVKNSPYRIDVVEIKKHLREKLMGTKESIKDS